ncbi:MAG: FAD:protein FMN transferase [Bacillota bacterium]
MSKHKTNHNYNQEESFRQKYLKPIFVIPLLFLIVLGGYFYYNAFYALANHEYTKIAMDTVVELRIQVRGEEEAAHIKEQVFEEMERLEGLFTRTLKGSDVYRVNEHAGQKPVKVSPEVFQLTEKALEYARLSDGAFDPTIAPITDLWGFLGQEYRVPPDQELKDKLSLVDYEKIELNYEESKIYLPEKGMALELGGIAKGFIVDQAIEILLTKGIEHAFINAGGDIGLIGSRPDGEPWRIGVRNPRHEQEMIAVLPVSDLAVVTSGDYERAFEEDGTRYHHILDPETGMPAEELASATILAESVAEADVLSTAIIVLGPERGMEIIEQKAGVEGILVTPDLEVEISSGIEDLVELR